MPLSDRMTSNFLSGPLRTWEPEPQPPKPPRPVWLIALSVGQGDQPCGIAVLHKTGEGRSAHYDCRYLCRLPPQTTYPELLSHLQKMLQRPELNGAFLIVEAGNCTEAVVRYLRRNKLPARIRSVEVRTSGRDGKSDGIWKVKQGTMIETARQAQQDKRLVFAEKMPPVVQETTPPVVTVYHALGRYQYPQTQSANEVFAAREGEHDDLVRAVALACWFGECCLGGFFIHVI